MMYPQAKPCGECPGRPCEDDRQTRIELGTLGQAVYPNGRHEHTPAVQKLTGVQPPSPPQHSQGLRHVSGSPPSQGTGGRQNRADAINTPTSGRPTDSLVVRECGCIPDLPWASLESTILSYYFWKNLNMQI